MIPLASEFIDKACLPQRAGWIQRLTNRNRLFLAVIFFLSIVTHLPYLLPGGPSASSPGPVNLNFDEGTVLYDSYRITCGEVIYRDFFEFQGPVFYYLYAGLFAFTGPSVAAARALNLIVTAITAVLIALLVTRSLGLTAGAAASAVHACLLVPMWPHAYPHWLAETFALAGIYLLATRTNHPTRELLAGICFGMSIATIQSLGLPIFAATLPAAAMPGIVLHRWKEACARPIRVIAGALLGIAPFILHLGLAGALNQMWYATFEWVLTHYPEGQKDASMLGYGAYLNDFIVAHATVARPWRDLAVIALHLIKFLPICAICGAIVATIRAFINRFRRSSDDSDLMIGLAAFAGVATLVLGITRTDIVHISFVGSFGLCGAAIALSRLGTLRAKFYWRHAMVWAIVGILVVVNFSAKTFITFSPSRRMQTWRGEVLKFPMARWVDINVGPKERVVFAFMAGLQYLYVRRSAVGFTYVPGVRPKYFSPNYFSHDQWRELGRQILDSHPPIVQLNEAQWLQITQWTPDLSKIYRRIDNRFLFRDGFVPGK